METIRQLLNNLQSSFATLSSREKKMVGFGSVAFGVFVLFLVIFNFSNTASTIRGRTQGKLARLQEVQDLAATYREAKGAQEAMEQILQQAVAAALKELKEHVTSVKVLGCYPSA